MKRNEITVHLTGGLGIQLFQLAAALSESPSGIKIETVLGKPRVNHDGVPEVFSFDFSLPVTTSNRKFFFPYFSAKVAGFVLRSGVSPTRFERIEAIRILINALASIVLSITGGAPIRIIQGREVGYSELRVKSRRNYLIGYFQSHRYADSVRELISKFSISEPGTDLEGLRKLAALERPLVVHYRFGDYLLEDNFGLPSFEYYLESITGLWQTNKFQKIWVFSDDLENAKTKFPHELLNHVRWIDQVDSSAASTLEAMREGFGFVIANSSFSWWGAYLAHFRDAPVIAPKPWFQGMDSPIDLIPTNWKTRSAKAQ